MIYAIAWLLYFVIIKVYLRRRVYGRENAPEKGPFIFVSNHESNADPFLLGTSLAYSKWFYYLAKKELFEKSLSGWYFRQIHALPIDRENPEIGVLKKVFKVLNSGRPLILFPEGTRSKDGSLGTAKAGVGFIVAKAGVPVLPAYIQGSREAMPESLSSLKFGSRVNIFIGKPLYFNGAVKNGKQDYQFISDEIMKSIAALKKEYADKVV